MNNEARLWHFGEHPAPVFSAVLGLLEYRAPGPTVRWGSMHRPWANNAWERDPFTSPSWVYSQGRFHVLLGEMHVIVNVHWS